MVPQTGRLYVSDQGNPLVISNTTSVARNPSTVGWPATGNYMVCFDNNGDLTSAKVGNFYFF